MRKGRSIAARTLKKPATAEAGALLGRKFAIKLFDRNEGEAANWPLIAETLFKAAFNALDKSPEDTRRTMLLRHVHAGSYERLTADPRPDESHNRLPKRGLASGIQVTGVGGCRCLPQCSLTVLHNARYHLKRFMPI